MVKKPIITHKLPVDTLVEVWDDDIKDLNKGYWSHYEEGLPRCFGGETTSQTEISISSWLNYRILENPWTPWFGGECPVAPWVKVRVRYRSDRVRSIAHEARHPPWAYSGSPKGTDVIAYQIVKQNVPK